MDVYQQIAIILASMFAAALVPLLIIRVQRNRLDEQRETITIQRAEIERLQRVMCRVEKVEKRDDVLDAEFIG